MDRSRNWLKFRLSVSCPMVVSTRRSAPRASLVSLGKEMPEHGFTGLAPGLRTSQDGAPVLEEGDLHDLVLPGAHPHVRGALRFLEPVGGNAPQAPLNQQGQCIPCPWSFRYWLVCRR